MPARRPTGANHRAHAYNAALCFYLARAAAGAFSAPAFCRLVQGNFLGKFEHALARCTSPQQPQITYITAHSNNNGSNGAEKNLAATPKNEPSVNKKAPDADILTNSPTQAAVNPATVRPGNYKPPCTFENFIHNAKNKFPVASAKKFASGQGHGLFILYGSNAPGKSHVLLAIYEELKKNVTKKVKFFNSLYELETFCSNSFKKSDSPLSCLTAFNYVLIDDAHSCAQNEVLQELLVRILEFCSANSINCALTLDAHPAEYSTLGVKLRSVLEYGLLLELKKPDLDVRTQYVQRCAAEMRLHIKAEDALNIARMYSDFRQMHGVMLKIYEFNSLANADVANPKDLKLDLILKNSIPSQGQKLTPGHIINCTAAFFNTDPAKITGKSRQQNIVLARHVAMFLCRELLGAQFGSIGSIFEGRDHSSVLYSVNKISKLCKSNKDTNNLVSEVKNICLK